MNATYLVVGSLLFLFLGYRLYSRFLARRIYRTEYEGSDEEKLPSETMQDGIDYVPTNKYVLYGHHFSSIAGAAPILGPAIAIIWGWVPALIWVVFGTILMGAVHDYGSLVLSARHDGLSIGSLTERIIGRRSRFLFLTIIFILIFVVLAVFAYLIANLFVMYPGSVIPINFEILVAIGIGWYINRKKGNLLIPSILALLSLYFVIWIGFKYPIHLPEYLWIGGSEVLSWIVFLLIYGFIASVLPVWLLLQPRDYVNSHKLIIGLGLIYAGIFVTQPQVDAPALNFSEGASMPWFPFLFITIACGAISGFHSLVASGTTSKQLKRISHARPVGYGGMIGEATLAVAATIAVAAGFSGPEAWHAHYADWGAASGMAPSLQAFVDGTASFLHGLGITATMTDSTGQTQTLAAVFISVLVISFAATSLDTGVRIQRYIILVMTDGAGKGGLRLWPLFGGTNQLVGSLTLLVISIWLLRQGRNYWYTLVPMIFITIVTFIGTLYSFKNYLSEQNIPLVSMTIIIAICQVWIILEAISVFRKHKAKI
jgi:carbon starvation protein